jgi:hypothetical protein
MPKPKLAPACEYVAIPEGSSSAAPVTTPGPCDFNIVLMEIDEDDFEVRELSCLFVVV